MSLFPAYAEDVNEKKVDYGAISDSGGLVEQQLADVNNVSPIREAQLLLSDNDEDVAAPRATVTSLSFDTDLYYCDRKLDCGNLWVSTLYYPGRPQYLVRACRAVRAARTAQRYWHAPACDVTDDADAEVSARVAAYRNALTERPHDQQLWLQYIDFMERCRGASAALDVTTEAFRTAGEGPHGERLCATLYRLRSAALAPAERRRLLRAELDVAREPRRTIELWVRLLKEVARDGGAAELDDIVASALAAMRHSPLAYPHLLYVYGLYLRAAGLWERLVMLLELTLAMNFPPAEFPPAVVTDAVRLDVVERKLQQTEDKALSSALPSSAVWVRVERARASAHWRSCSHTTSDPQRTSLPADVAELLQPVHQCAHTSLLVYALLLAKVPMLPVSAYAHYATLCNDDASCAELLLCVLRAGRRLPPSHPARHALHTQHAQYALAHLVHPPHYFTDDNGYLSWLNSLWDACCMWTSGDTRVAFMCWRLRWIHALVLLIDDSGASEARRLCTDARAAVKRWARDVPLLYAHLARIEHAAGERDRARRAATHALRAVRDRSPHERLYIARVVTEVCDVTPHDSTALWAYVCAVTGATLPQDLAHAPPSDVLIQEALRVCETQCRQIETTLDQTETNDTDGAMFVRAQLPHVGEWSAARARLATPQRRVELLSHARVCAAESPARSDAARYWEHAACALTVEAARDSRMSHAARTFAPHYSHNALLALGCGDSVMSASESRVISRTNIGALAIVAPALVRAGGERDASRLAGVCARVARGGAGGALLHTIRVEAEARSSHPRPRAALLTALDSHPNDKWLYVRGAELCPADAHALHDAILERGLRAHALLDELQALTTDTRQ